MKLEHFLKLLSNPSARIRLVNKDFARELERAERAQRATSDFEIDIDPETEDAHYELNLSGEEPTEIQKTAQVVLEQNVQEFERQNQLGQVDLPETPASLSASLSKPQEDFESFFQKITADLNQLAEAHSELDRERVSQLLSIR